MHARRQSAPVLSSRTLLLTPPPPRPEIPDSPREERDRRRLPRPPPSHFSLPPKQTSGGRGPSLSPSARSTRAPSEASSRLLDAKAAPLNATELIALGWQGYGLQEAIMESERMVREAATALYQEEPGSPGFKLLQGRYRETQKLLASKKQCQVAELVFPVFQRYYLTYIHPRIGFL